MEYSGNAIYEYVYNEDLDYYYSAKDNWMLVYGNSASIPKILVFASKVENIASACSDKEMQEANKAFSFARYLKLPFIFVRFMVNNDQVGLWEESAGNWRTVTYDQLRDIYERYGVVQPGTAKKRVNQYTSSPYHDWQRNNLGRITVSDFDLIKFSNGQWQEIIELKRSKYSMDKWNPFTNDYPNFALLINTIVGSGKNISFSLYYNLLKDGPMGSRVEDISIIKVYDFIIPDEMITSNQVKYQLRGYYKLEKLLS